METDLPSGVDDLFPVSVQALDSAASALGGQLDDELPHACRADLVEPLEVWAGGQVLLDHTSATALLLHGDVDGISARSLNAPVEVVDEPAEVIEVGDRCSARGARRPFDKTSSVAIWRAPITALWKPGTITYGIRSTRDVTAAQ
jgi:hypothetical protein